MATLFLVIVGVGLQSAGILTGIRTVPDEGGGRNGLPRREMAYERNTRLAIADEGGWTAFLHLWLTPGCRKHHSSASMLACKRRRRSNLRWLPYATPTIGYQCCMIDVLEITTF